MAASARSIKASAIGKGRSCSCPLVRRERSGAAPFLGCSTHSIAWARCLGIRMTRGSCGVLMLEAGRIARIPALLHAEHSRLVTSRALTRRGVSGVGLPTLTVPLAAASLGLLFV